MATQWWVPHVPWVEDGSTACLHIWFSPMTSMRIDPHYIQKTTHHFNQLVGNPAYELSGWGLLCWKLTMNLSLIATYRENYNSTFSVEESWRSLYIQQDHCPETFEFPPCFPPVLMSHRKMGFWFGTSWGELLSLVMLQISHEHQWYLPCRLYPQKISL